jgi:hypothetical protein
MTLGLAAIEFSEIVIAEEMKETVYVLSLFE